MQNAKTVRKLFKFTGILEEISQTLQIKYQECLTVSIRAKLCETKTGSNGNGTKFDLCRTLCKKYDWEYPVDKNGEEIYNDQYWFFNVTDALGSGIYYIRLSKGEIVIKDKKKTTKKKAIKVKTKGEVN